MQNNRLPKVIITMLKDLLVKILNTIQSTTRITEFFVVGDMSGVLVGFVILVGVPIETRRGKYR